jgi:cytoskeletal protein CcmA (bactofilin family)
MRWRRGGGVPDRGELTVFLDEASEVEGSGRFTGTAMLNGRYTGEIASTDTVIVGDKAVVHASIRAATVIIRGEVTGNVVATERAELRGRGRLTGDLEAPVLVVDEGAALDGRCRMSSSPEVSTPVFDGGGKAAARAAFVTTR